MTADQPFPGNPHYQENDPDDGEGCPDCGYNSCVCDIMDEADRWTCPACGHGPSNAAAHAG